MNVIKRDGREVEFNIDKIIVAINKAMKKCNKQDDDFCKKIATDIKNINRNLDVEEIQDIIEKKLMASSHKDVAKEFILYRNKRSIERLKKNKMIKIAKNKLSAKNIENQNANVDEHSFGGRMGEASDIIWKNLALEEVCSQMAKENHENNLIYIHDLNSYFVGMHNCLTLPIDDLLKNGFDTRQTDVRPASSINTAFQLVAVLFQLQSLQQFGGVSASHIDWTMIPYIRKSFFKHYINGAKYIKNKNEKWIDKNIKFYINEPDKFKDEQSIENSIWKKEPKIYKYAIDMTKRELEQAVEGFFHNLNTLQSRSGNQLNMWLA